MPQSPTTNVVELFVILVALATLAALIVRRIGIPYTVVLVLLGLAASAFRPGLQLEVPPELILTVFLPGLVFESGYRLDLDELRRSFGFVAALAVPGVIITAGIVAAVLAIGAGIEPGIGFVVGAMLAATDPAAVIATMKRMHAPERLSTLIEAESVFNDGTAIVVFAVAVSTINGGLSLIDAGVSIILTVTVSGLIGLGAGFLGARLIRRIDDHLIELSVSLVLAYGTYILADLFHESGIIATVVAAIVLGTSARHGSMNDRSREALETVWEFAAFLLTALLFLLVGLVIDVPALLDSLVPDQPRHRGHHRFAGAHRLRPRGPWLAPAQRARRSHPGRLAARHGRGGHARSCVGGARAIAAGCPAAAPASGRDHLRHHALHARCAGASA